MESMYVHAPGHKDPEEGGSYERTRDGTLVLRAQTLPAVGRRQQPEAPAAPAPNSAPPAAPHTENQE